MLLPERGGPLEDFIMFGYLSVTLLVMAAFWYGVRALWRLLVRLVRHLRPPRHATGAHRHR